MSRALIASFGFCVLFGLQVVLQSSFLRAPVHPLHLLFFIYLTCFAILTAYSAFIERRAFTLRVSRATLLWFMLQTILWIIADMTVFLGLTTSSSVNYSILSRLQLFITYLGAVWFLGETVTGRKISALLLGFAGSLLVVFSGQRLTLSAGDVLFVVSAVAISVSGLLRQKIARHIPSLVMTYWMFAVAVITVGIIAFAAAPYAGMPDMRNVSVIAVLAIGGFTMVNYAIGRGGASQFTLVASLLPVMTAVFAYVLLGEVPGVNQFVGGAVILSSIALFVSGKRSDGSS